MKYKLKTPAKKKRNRTANLFWQAITYRTPLPVTKVMVYWDDTAFPICPRCKTCLEREYIVFCYHCGQKLNWKFFDYAMVVRPGYKQK